MKPEQIRAWLLAKGSLQSVFEHETLTPFHNFANAPVLKQGTTVHKPKLDEWVAEYLDATALDVDMYAGGIGALRG